MAPSKLPLNIPGVKENPSLLPSIYRIIEYQFRGRQPDFVVT
jgi:hypothetical protein